MTTEVPLWVPIATATIAFLAVLVPAIAIYFTRNNLFKQLNEQRSLMERQFTEQRSSIDSQMRTQLVTTINKEWVLKVRDCIAKLIECSLENYSIRLNYPLSEISTRPEYKKALTEYRNTRIILSLYLDFGNELERNLYHTLTGRVWDLFTFPEEYPTELSDLIIDIQECSQVIFRIKESPIKNESN